MPTRVVVRSQTPVAPLVNWRKFLDVWRYDRGDGVVFLLTAVAVLLLGIVIGVALSMALFVWRAGHPHIAEVGRVLDTQHYRNIKRHAVETWPGLRIFRVDESLTFVNATKIRDHLVDAVVHGDNVHHVILHCTAINYIDSSALEMLESVAKDLRDAGATFHLAEVKGPVMDSLREAGLIEHLAPGKVFFRIDDAVAEFSAEPEILASRPSEQRRIQTYPMEVRS